MYLTIKQITVKITKIKAKILISSTHLNPIVNEERITIAINGRTWNFETPSFLKKYKSINPKVGTRSKTVEYSVKYINTFNGAAFHVG